MSRGISQSTAVNYTVRIDRDEQIDRCFKCSNYLLTLCQLTNTHIPYPISGPILADCPLPIGYYGVEF